MLHILRGLQAIAAIAIASGAIAMLGYTVLALFGAADWLHMPTTFGEITLLNFGIYVQLAATALMVSTALLIPTNMRLNALERSHRSARPR